MKKNYTFDEIESYLGGDMSAKNKQVFAKELEQNSNLSNEVKEHKEAHEAVELYTRMRLKDKIKGIQQQTRMTQVKTLQRRRFIVQIAAGLAFFAIMALVYFLVTQEGPLTPQQAYDNNFELYDEFTHMGAADETAFDNGLALYKQFKYRDAIAQFSKVSKDSKDFPSALLCTSIAQLALNDSDSAKSNFSSIIEQQLPNWDVAKWYLALAYLKDNEVAKAKVTLNNIVDNGGYNAKKAKVLLKRLE